MSEDRTIVTRQDGDHVHSVEVEVLSRDECLQLLAKESLGRLAVVVDQEPEIYPVNYVVDGDRVVFRSGEGTKLEHSSIHPVAFEVDHFDSQLDVAWSVVIKGFSREITTALDESSERERLLPIEPFGIVDGTHWLRIIPREISGRRLRRLSV